MKVISVDNEVVVSRWLAYPFSGTRFQRAEGHRQMVVIDKFLAFECQFCHL